MTPPVTNRRGSHDIPCKRRARPIARTSRNAPFHDIDSFNNTYLLRISGLR